MPGRTSLPCTLVACLSLFWAVPTEAAPQDNATVDEAPRPIPATPDAMPTAAEPAVAPPEGADGAQPPALPPGEAPAVGSIPEDDDAVQGPEPDAEPPPPPRPVVLPPLRDDGMAFEPPVGVPQEHLQWDVPVTCLIDSSGEIFLRFQCRPPRGREAEVLCLYSAGRETRDDGGDGPELERVQPCSQSYWTADGGLVALLEDQLPDGARLVPAIAEAPVGWRRDERGRVFQVNFDLYRRVYLGTRWYPALISPTGMQLGRVGLELGSRIELLSDDLRYRYRLQALTGEVLLNPLGVSGTLLRFDLSHDADDPFLRVTTFWGEPARHDAYADIGGWFDVLGVEYRPRNSNDEVQLRFLAGGVTWDLWHSADMYSYVRLRVGGAFDDLYLDRDGYDNRLALGPVAAVEGDLTFDEDGFHHLTFVSSYEAPFVWREDAGAAATFTQRFSNEVAYELIFLAINDQPLTLRAAVGGGYRSDVEAPAAGWELTAGLGLRFSFWVPARDLEALRELRAGGRN